MKENTSNMYSVILLKESVVLKIKNKQDMTKIFEESIILVRLPNNFFDSKSKDDLLLYFRDKVPTLEYKNGYGEDVEINVVYVVDYFEVLNEIEAADYTEIYSRHFIEDYETSVVDILNKYYLK